MSDTFPLTASKGDREWVAQAGSQQLYLSSPIFETLYEGTRGPGKTDALLMSFAQHCGVGWGAAWRGVLFRQTYKQLSDVVAKCRHWFPIIFGRRNVKFNESLMTWRCSTGEELLLRHMRVAGDYDNYHGHAYPWIGFEELTNWKDLVCYEAMRSCSRSTVPGIPLMMRSTCNPFGIGHNAVKTYFIDPAPRGVVIPSSGNIARVAIHGNLLENKKLMIADPSYLDKLKAIKGDAQRAAWLFGSWNITAGGMFDDIWRSDAHILRAIKVPHTWRIERAYDHGQSKPFSVGWWAVSDGSYAEVVRFDGTVEKRFFPKKSLVRIGEWYGWSGERNEGVRMLATPIAKGIKQREEDKGIRGRVEPGPADTMIFNTNDEGNSVAGLFSRAGVRFLEANKAPGTRKVGWDLMRDMLNNATLEDDAGPGMWVTAECEQFIATVPSLPRDPIDMDDVDTESEDHIGDEARYEVLHQHRVATMTDG